MNDGSMQWNIASTTNLIPSRYFVVGHGEAKQESTTKSNPVTHEFDLVFYLNSVEYFSL